MSNQTENKMNVLSGICSAPMIDGIYSFCESKETITDLYTVLHALYESERYSEAYRLLCALCAALPIPDCPNLPPLTEDEMPIFIQNFVEDFFEILCEYHKS